MRNDEKRVSLAMDRVHGHELEVLVIMWLISTEPRMKTSPTFRGRGFFWK